MKCQIAQETRIGRRAQNQDRLGCWQTGKTLLLAIADGMGGHAHGALGAEIAMRALAQAFQWGARPRLADPDLFLFRAVHRAHAALCAHARGHGLADTPRTTIVGCVVQDGCAYWTHVGDSRLYVIRGGDVVAQTRDQTLVQKLVDRGEVSEQDAVSHPQRNVLLQCLGGPARPHVEPARSLRLHRGDKVLLCSDGFFGGLRTGEIVAALGEGALERAVMGLADAAEERGGPRCDNLSVLAMAWQEDEAVAPAPHSASVQAAEPDFLSLTDAEVEREVERLRQAFRAGRAPAPAEPDNLSVSDAEIEREIERIRQTFRRSAPQPAPPPGATEFLSDEQIEREIDRIRQAFRAGGHF